MLCCVEKPALDVIFVDKGDLSNNYGVWNTLLGYKENHFLNQHAAWENHQRQNCSKLKIIKMVVL